MATQLTIQDLIEAFAPKSPSPNGTRSKRRRTADSGRQLSEGFSNLILQFLFGHQKEGEHFPGPAGQFMVDPLDAQALLSMLRRQGQKGITVEEFLKRGGVLPSLNKPDPFQLPDRRAL